MSVLTASLLLPVVVAVPGVGFSMGRTPVTNAEFAPFLASGRAVAPPWWEHPDFNALDQPVVGVTWHDGMAYAGWLGEVHGGRWRLPMEDEWEHAMRGGLQGAPTAWGAGIPVGEIPQGALAGPWRVGRGTPNGYGLMDPGTVVHEWCLDAFSPRASGDPGWRPAQAERKASRGGSWRHRVRWSPPAARSSLLPHLRYADYGFRVLREVES
jgi:sulfatase modifying factor 1